MDSVTQEPRSTIESNVLPTTQEWDNPDRYSARWISRAIAQAGVEAPDAAQAGGRMELLESLHNAYLGGGAAAAKAAWQPVSKYVPELAAIVRQPEQMLYHADELAQLPQPKYIIDDLPLYHGGTNMIVGPSGSGKSFLALDFAAKSAQDTNVIYIVGEGLLGYASRWESWKEHHGGKSANLWFYPQPLDFSNHNEVAVFVDMVSSKKPALVIVDTVARCSGHYDENSTTDMNQLIGESDFIRRELNTSILLVHHTGHEKKHRMRGSSVLYSAADAVLMVSTSDGVMSVYNDPDRGGKNKDAAPWEPLYRRFLPVEVTRDDKEFSSVVLVPTEKIEYDLGDDDLLTEKQREIVDLLEDLEECTSKEIADMTGIPRRTVQHNLRQLVKREIIVKDKEFYRAAQ